MVWSIDGPPPPVKPAVVGWFAILNVLSQQTLSMANIAYIIGVMAAFQTVSINNALSAKGFQNADQSLALTNVGQITINPAGTQDFSITDSALLAGAPIVLSNLTITDLATIAAASTALQQLSINVSGSSIGLQSADQETIVTNTGHGALNPVGIETFSIIDGATVLGNPITENSFSVLESSSIVGVILSLQQISILNSGVVTGFEGTLSGEQIIPIVNAATLIGMQAAGQTFTFVNAATVAGSSNADQIFALTESGAVAGVRTGTVTLAMSDAGTVYAIIAAAQSISLSNSATAFEDVAAPTAVEYGGIVGSLPSAQSVGTHTFTSTANEGDFVLVSIVIDSNSAGIGSCSYDGKPMMYLGFSSAGTQCRLYLYGIRNVPGGAKQVVFNSAGSGSRNIAARAFSYRNVRTVYNAAWTGGSSNPSITVSSLGTGDLAIVAGACKYNLTWTGGTQRFNGGNGAFMDIRDTDTAPTTFTATPTNQSWIGATLVLSSEMRVKGAAAAAAGSIALPAHLPGDEIYLYVFSASTLSPVKPGYTGAVPMWDDAVTPLTNSNALSSRLCHTTAVLENTHTSGSWSYG